MAHLGSAFLSYKRRGWPISRVRRDLAWRDDERISNRSPPWPYTCNDRDLQVQPTRRVGSEYVHIHAAENMHHPVSSKGEYNADPGARRDGCAGSCDHRHGTASLMPDIGLLAAFAPCCVTHGPTGYLKYAIGPLTPIRGFLSGSAAVTAPMGSSNSKLEC